MDTLYTYNKALAYIDEHLEGEIDIQSAAKIACCSEYHFRRMFSYLSGISLSEYIRRRKLTMAAKDLSENDVKVIDVAVKYGYKSPDSFSRAFQALHGVLPSQAGERGVRLKAFPKMTFKLTIGGEEEMNYNIVEKEDFKIAGIKKRVPLRFHGVNEEIAKMYEMLNPDLIRRLKSLSDQKPEGIISASANFSEERMEEKGDLDHYIGVITSNETLSDLDVLEVKKTTWAVFESIGPFPETLQNIWGRIYSEWFPSSGFESVEGPEILWHESPDTSNPSYRSEIWIPVRSKQK